MALDLAAPADGPGLQGMLAGVDIVVNTVGIFMQAGQQSFDAIHVNGPSRLLAAARAAGVQRWIQLSALGADPGSPLPYFASKGRMDQELLAAEGIEAGIVRPSLVYAPEGASTRLFAGLAALPVTPLPGGGGQQVQPVHLEDLLDALVALAEAPRVPPVLDAVGPRPLSLRDYLRAFKRPMAAGNAFVAVPMAVARPLARLGPFIARMPLDADALAMLQAGNTAPAGEFQRWLGRPLRDPDGFVAPAMATALRDRVLLAWLVPLMRVALVAMWLGTALVSLAVYPRADSLEMLARVGLHGSLAVAALWTGALADLALGLGVLVRRLRTATYALQFLLVAGYTVIITLWLPEQWAHPFGPVLKNVPLLALILALLMLDRTDGPDPR